MTNATKGIIIAFVNAILQLVVAFGVSLDDAKTASITAVVNTGLALWVAFTYKNSSKRVPE